MAGEVVLIDKKIQLSYLFNKPEKTFYITHPSWAVEAENIITEDARYVMGLSYSNTSYKPIPFEIFKTSLENLARRKALEIKPSELREEIDFNPVDFSQGDISYILDSSGILVRLRNDGKKGVHTMSLIGNRESLIKIAEIIFLPHPFDFRKYPYKNIFKDMSGADGKILSLA